MKSAADHYSHALRRGPLVDTRVRGWICLDCRVWGEAPIVMLAGVSDWIEADYEANKGWLDPEA